MMHSWMPEAERSVVSLDPFSRVMMLRVIGIPNAEAEGRQLSD